MKRIVKKALLTIKYRIMQKSYKDIKYVLEKSKTKSDTLIVSFSGFSKMGNPPVYNYESTLRPIDANKLFILDDTGYNKAGSYYLGENGVYDRPPQIVELINTIKSDDRINKVITIGSSKGGSAALYFGLMLDAQYVVIGAPQYKIGSYLATDAHLPILKALCGEVSDSKIEMLDTLIKTEIVNHRGNGTKVAIHYSPLEHTYKDQIKDMIIDLRANGYCVEEDNAYSYTNHGDVAKYYGTYLLKTVKRIV